MSKSLILAFGIVAAIPLIPTAHAQGAPPDTILLAGARKDALQNVTKLT